MVTPIDDKIKKDFDTATLHTSLAYIFADIAHSNLMLADQYLHRTELKIPRTEFNNFLRMREMVKMCMNELTATTKDMYNCATTDALCINSDWIQDCIMAIIERTNNNEYAQQEMLEYIKKKKKSIKVK